MGGRCRCPIIAIKESQTVSIRSRRIRTGMACARFIRGCCPMPSRSCPITGFALWFIANWWRIWGFHLRRSGQRGRTDVSDDAGNDWRFFFLQKTRAIILMVIGFVTSLSLSLSLCNNVLLCDDLSSLTDCICVPPFKVLLKELDHPHIVALARAEQMEVLPELHSVAQPTLEAHSARLCSCSLFGPRPRRGQSWQRRQRGRRGRSVRHRL